MSNVRVITWSMTKLIMTVPTFQNKIKKDNTSPAFALLLSISLQMPGMNHADVFHPFPYIPDDNPWQQVSVVYF